MRIVSTFVLLLFFCACQQEQAKKQLIEGAPLLNKEISDDTGRTLSIPNRPQKIVSIAPNITEIIFAVGGGDKLVARSQACDYPSKVQEKAFITTYPSVDLEEIKATQGDLIITTDEIFSGRDIELIERTGIPVYLQSYRKLEDVFRGIKKIGELSGNRAKANYLSDSLELIVERVADSTRDLIKYNTAILISQQPLKVVGGSGFLHELLELAGGKNAFADNERSYPETTAEQLLFLQPEVLIIPSRDQQIYAELLSMYPALQDLPASINKQVYLIDPDLVYRPGPRMVRGLIEMTSILHSKLTIQSFIDARE